MAYNTVSVVRQSPYFITDRTKGFGKQKEDEKSSQSSNALQTQDKETAHQINPNAGKKTLEQQLLESKASQKEAIASRDANLKNSTVNIAQILKDFKNTAKAIGTPPELMDEINIYLSLVEKQLQKKSPDTKLVRSNLKNASVLLDNYITETLQRQSNVVSNWLDALFLQQINYKFDEKEINPNFLVKFPEQKNEEQVRNHLDENTQKIDENKSPEIKKTAVPADEKLKSLFIQAKKHTYANNHKKAMELFKEALDRAIETGDNETESKVLFEIGKIYDKNDYLAQALTSYNKSLTATKDLDIKTRAHYSMAQIYDDVSQFEPAINHYMSSISYAGESENLIAQSTSLTKIGNIYSDEYKKGAFDFLLEADLIAAETNDSKVKGFVSSNIANAYNKFNEPQNALKFYSDAVKEYQKSGAHQKAAVNYKRAAELMQDFNNPQKAKSLYQKALVKARLTEDVHLMKEIHQALNMIALI